MPAHSHSHTINIDAHSHDVYIPSHTHDFTIPAHNHQIEIPAHSHEIIPGIYKFGDAKSFSIFINGVKKASFDGRTAELDLTNFLLGDDKKYRAAHGFLWRSDRMISRISASI